MAKSSAAKIEIENVNYPGKTYIRRRRQIRSDERGDAEGLARRFAGTNCGGSAKTG